VCIEITINNSTIRGFDSWQASFNQAWQRSVMNVTFQGWYRGWNEAY
jgi:hypothetical protein